MISLLVLDYDVSCETLYWSESTCIPFAYYDELMSILTIRYKLSTQNFSKSRIGGCLYRKGCMFEWRNALKAEFVIS